jgi:hypothetical protein
MFDQLVDGIRKASESSLHMQQEMLRNLTRVLLSSAPAGGGGTSGDNKAAQKRWLELGIETLHKHREALDSTYKSGIQIIEKTLHLAEVKSGEDYKKVAEDLSRTLFDLQKEQAENQLRDFQTLFEKSAVLAKEVRV